MISRQWLPPEVWTMVFQMIAKRSNWPSGGRNLENVRLTCKLFADLAAPFFTDRIICAPLSSSLATLTAVSRHPIFSRSIKEVIYTCNRYNSFETSSEYKEALQRARSGAFSRFEELKCEEKNLEWETAFSQYDQHYRDQTTMENSGEVIACLCSALMRMPNIEKITVSPNYYCYLGTYHYSEYLLEPEPAYNEAFLLMARVMSLTEAKIRELDIQSNDDLDQDRGGLNGAAFLGMSHLNLSHCCDAFRGLRKITITADEDDIDGWMTGNFAKILSEATDLESLHFDGGHGTHISIKNILSTAVWSCLTSLCFNYATFDQGAFLSFLQRHSGTLKNIDLFCIWLRNGSWKILLEGMKSSLSLQDISIDEAYEENDEDGEISIYLNPEALEDYLFRDGSHPLLDVVEPGYKNVLYPDDLILWSGLLFQPQLSLV